MTKTVNPYSVPTEDAGPDMLRREVSTWRRNFTSLGAIVLTYCSVAMLFAITRNSLAPLVVYPLIVVSFVGSTWSNFQLGPRIGWGRGGLPIMFILIFGWMVAYVLISLVGAGVVYWAFDPERLLH